MTRPRWAVVAIATLAAILTAAAIGRSIVASPSPVSGGRDQPASPSSAGGARDQPASPSSAGGAQPASPSSVSGARDQPSSLRPPPGFVTFRARRGTFSIAYPPNWARRRLTDPQVALLVTRGSSASLLVRVTRIGLKVTTGTLPIVRGLTDKLVRADRRVRLLGPPRAIVLGGLPGYRYLYTFNASGTRQRGAHAHYFLFKGGKMIALVFQVVPARRLSGVAPMLDQVLRTFRGNAG